MAQNVTMQPVELPGVDSLDQLIQQLTHPMWVLQEKLDGKRVLLVLHEDREPEFLHREGGPTHVPDVGLRAALASLREDTILDGELVRDPATGLYVLHVFDVLRLRGEDTTTRVLGGFEGRMALLWTDVSRLAHEAGCRGQLVTAPFHPCERGVGLTHNDTSVAVMKAHEMFRTGKEGFVLKRLDRPYVAGRCDWRDPAWIKFKFVSDATVRSRGPAPDGAWAFLMEVLEDGEWVPCGRCTVPWNAGYVMGRDFAPGTLWEVRYLYATKDHVLYQPRIAPAGRRDDLTDDAAVRAQFRYRNANVAAPTS